MDIKLFCKELFCYNYWVMGIRRIEADDQRLYSSMDEKLEFQLIMDEPLVTVADPYLVEDKGKLWLLYERQDLRTEEKRGELRAVLVDDLMSGKLEEHTTYDMKLGSSPSDKHVLNGPRGAKARDTLVCSEGFHLSYPQVVELDNEKFLVPESGQGNAMRLYRCLEFPGRWEYVRDIMSGSFVDTNIVDMKSYTYGNYDYSYFYFTYRDKRLEVYGANSLDEQPQLSYRGHVNKRLRGAGYVFQSSEGEMIRPCQDCSDRYGGAIEFRKIMSTKGRHFEGELISRVVPEKITFEGTPYKRWQIGGIHTYNYLDGFEVVDLLVYVFSPMAVVKNISRFLKKRLKKLTLKAGKKIR